MNRHRQLCRCILALAYLAFLIAAPAWAQTFEIDWYSIDGGGGVSAIGVPMDYKLIGTIAQPDAAGGPMTGGGFTMSGGFWPVAADICPLPGDMNLDGQRDGLDLQAFVNCLLGTGAPNCSCADLDGNGSLGGNDAAVFVPLLLGT